MSQPIDTDLKERARAMLVEMTVQTHWVYAIAASPGLFDDLCDRLGEAGCELVARDPAAAQARFRGPTDALRFTVLGRHNEGAVLLEAFGEEAVPILAALLEATGFIAQSTLWQQALGEEPTEASRALALLSPMALVWAREYSELFLKHLQASELATRRAAALSLGLACLASGRSETAEEIRGDIGNKLSEQHLTGEFRALKGLFGGRKDNPLDLVDMHALIEGLAE